MNVDADDSQNNHNRINNKSELILGTLKLENNKTVKREDIYDNK